MRPVSARFLSSITGSHRMAARARVVAPGQTGVNPVGTQVKIVNGDVTIDGGAAIRSNLQLSIEPDDLWPDESSDLLTPYGNELFVERGLSYGGGSFEYVSLGYFRINLVEQDNAPSGPIRITATDRMSNILDAKMVEIQSFAANTQIGDVVGDLLFDAYGALEIEWDDDTWTDTLGRAAQVEGDRHAFVNELITSRGKVWYFDYRGILVIKSPPDPRVLVWVVSRGRGGVLVSAARTISREGVYNGVLATGEGLDTEVPVRGLAVDDDPTSPTYWSGPFGKVPREYASPLLKTDGAAQLAARTILQRSLGLPYSVSFQSVPNPALEPDDPIAVGIVGTPRLITPTLLAGDSFSRTVVDGVGTSESGHTWFTSGTASTWQVNNGLLHKNIVTANEAHSALMGTTVGRLDVDLSAKFQAVATPTGGSLVCGFVARRDTTGYLDALRLEFNTNGMVSLKMSSIAATYDEYAHLPNFAAYDVGEWWNLRAVVLGPLRLIKAWRDGDPEPFTWMLQAEDYVNTTGTRFGLWYWKTSGNTNVGSVLWRTDNFKAQSAEIEVLEGGELHIIDSLTVPLTATQAMSASTRKQFLGTIGVTS